MQTGGGDTKSSVGWDCKVGISGNVEGNLGCYLANRGIVDGPIRFKVEVGAFCIFSAEDWSGTQ